MGEMRSCVRRMSLSHYKDGRENTEQKKAATTHGGFQRNFIGAV
jgi:hypothetical protein